MAIYGADVVQLRDLAGAFDSDATRMDSGRAAVSNRIQLRSWIGPIAVRFRLNWESQYGPTVFSAAEELRSAARVLRERADRQTSASAADGVVAAGTILSNAFSGLADAAVGLLGPRVLAEWIHGAIGTGIDMDHRYGNQCVDVIKNYAAALFPDEAISKTIGYGNAGAVYANASPDYFDKLPPSATPRPGDIVCLGPTPYSSYGHVAVVSRIEDGVVYVVQQDGSKPDGTTFEGTISAAEWNCLQGYLRPKSE